MEASRLGRRLFPSLLWAQTIRRTIDRITRAGGKRASNGDPGAAGLAANKFFRLLIPRVSARRAHLLEVAKRLDELLRNAYVGPQAPQH